MPPAAVSVRTLQTQNVALTRELPGRVVSSLIAEVRPQVSGVVQKQLFTEGTQVQAGQALYQLDDASYRADVNSASATLARARATLKSAELKARRSNELVAIEAVSTQDHEDTTAALRQAQADVGVAKAALEGRQVVLDYARIVAPISGRIGKSSVTQGALVTAAQPAPLATVQQLDPVYVDLTQSASELLLLRKELSAGKLTATDNLPITILLEDGTPYEHKGKLAFSDVSVDPGTGSFGLRVTIRNPDQILMPGMYVRAVVGEGERRNGLLVPQRAVTRDPKGNASVMVVKNEQAELRPVQVSRTVGDQWLVEDGLSAGEQVIVEGLQKVQPGMPVTATEILATNDGAQENAASSTEAEEPTEAAPAEAVPEKVAALATSQEFVRAKTPERGKTPVNSVSAANAK